LYHNQETFKRSTKLIKSINKTKKGLSIIFGERGLGKTTLMNYITSNIDRLCIFIPSNMIDVVNTNDFKNLIRKNRNSLIVIDDCEIYFSNNFTKSNLLTNNILHMVDGITSDMDNMQIIIVLNTDSIHDIDPILLDCNNLIDVIEVERLSDSAADGLCKHLHLKNKSKNKRLVDILKKRKVEEDIIKMGFH
jgi:SpoVK/Ycf46/Vps4 family AAA+-type ATPase